ncbi:MAG: hypothetical protein KDK28_12610, partial [Maritimibacter sp.]|nr:hypothetical protein [Maritimibacter sp.]
DGIYGTADDLLDAGLDGQSGTADDGYGPNPGAYASDHDAFTVTDGVSWWDAGADGKMDTEDDVLMGDLDQTADGVITTSWYVREPDSLDERFLLTAQEVDLGEDGALGGGDDSYTGVSGTATFTDGLLVPGNGIKGHEVWDPSGADNGGTLNGEAPVLDWVPGQPKGYV